MTTLLAEPRDAGVLDVDDVDMITFEYEQDIESQRPQDYTCNPWLHTPMSGRCIAN